MRRSGRRWARPGPALAVLACLTAASLLPVATPPADAVVAAPDLAALVDPFVGTGSGGPVVGTVDTFPGADVPFGMVQWSPDTAPERPSGGGYDDTADQITGFSLTHLSGAGCAIFGDVPVLPTTGPVPTDPEAATEPFSHSTESAAPGRYQVSVGSPATAVALSVTTRTGIGRFTFAPATQANLLFKVSDSASGIHTASVRTVGNDEVEGTVDSGYFCDTLESYALHFVAVFSRPFTGHGTWRKSGRSPGSSSCSGSFQVDCGAWVSFDTTADRTVEVKVGLSYVSLADAAANLRAEDRGWSVAAVEARASAAWNAALSRIVVQGGTPTQRATFYTALYHCLLDPSTFSDDNGRYEGFDGRVHRTGGRVQYANFSEWDIYRSEVPLLSVIDPHLVSDMMQSLVNDAAQSGWLPVWAVADGDSGTVNGDSADPIIADAYALGVRGFDARRALAYMVKGAERPGTGLNQVSERPNLPAYEKSGYIAATAVNPNAATETIGASETLEYAIDDFAVSQMARLLGESSVARTLAARAQNWQNLFNPAVGSIEAKRSNGTFPPGPATQFPGPATQLMGIYQEGYAEGNAAQYTWSVPQDLGDLFALLGGDAAATADLNTFFTATNEGPWQPYDWAGNEPDLFVPWEYDATGAPWRTQAEVRTIATTDYSLTPAGEPGNDDLGAMSSWYVWAALGLYPLTPGTGDLVVGSPMFTHATVHLGGGKVLDIVGRGAPATYVASASLALGRGPAEPLDRPWIAPDWLGRGGTLRFVLSATPLPTWGAAPADAPPSYRTGAAPAVGFTGSAEVTVPAGSEVQTTVGAQSETSAALTLDWRASAPRGVKVTPASGRLSLLPGGPPGEGNSASSIEVRADAPGRYLVHVAFSVPGRRVLVAPVTLAVDAPAVAP